MGRASAFCEVALLQRDLVGVVVGRPKLELWVPRGALVGG
jgi:hypothetical protein